MSPAKYALTLSVPEAVPVRIIEQEADARVPVRVHVPPAVETVPVGVLGVPLSVSATVTVQLAASVSTIVDGMQLTDVVVVRRLVFTGFTVTDVLAELPEWGVLAESPP